MRLFIYEYLVEHSVPPVVEQLMTEFGLSRAETVAALRQLADERNVALVRGTARILMAWPFSAIATPFVVRAARSTLLRQLLVGLGRVPRDARRDITIEAFCHHCGGAIAIDMSRRQGHSRRAGRDAHLPSPEAQPMVGGHHHFLLEHDGLLLLARAP